MDKEKLLRTVAPLIALYSISLLAFSRQVRRDIGGRDEWACQDDCYLGKDGEAARFQDGYMVQAAHNDHDQDNYYYDEPETGRIACVAHHALEHLQKGEIRAAQAILNNGIYTYDAREKGIEEEQIKLHHTELEEYIEQVLAQYMLTI